MPKASIGELLASSPLMRPASRDQSPNAARERMVFRDEDKLKGRIDKGANATRMRSGALGGRLSKLIVERGGSGARAKIQPAKFAADARQRVVVVVSYKGHGSGGGAVGRLVAHGKYLERDGAGPGGEKGQFYDRGEDKVDAYPRLSEWGEDDPRHFRLMLAPESGARIEDLKDFTRATMARMERDLGMPLQWVAVNHHNTDNPHVHVILRGRTSHGREVILPRAYVGRGLRHAARDVATEMLGKRGREDERLALERETRGLGRNRLDQLLEAEITPGQAVRIQAIGRRHDPVLRAAMRERVRRLSLSGLTREEGRGRFVFAHDWVERLTERGQSVPITSRLARSIEGRRIQLYAQRMGELFGEVVELGRRGDREAKAYAIVRDRTRGPIFVNVRSRDIEGLEVGGVVEVQPVAHPGRGHRARLRIASAKPLQSQIEARAVTDLDRELACGAHEGSRGFALGPAKLQALEARIAWHVREGTGQCDLIGRFSFNPGALAGLRREEFDAAQLGLAQTTGKRVLDLNDGMERTWVVRGLQTLHQGRVALLERNDAVAVLVLQRRQHLTPGKAYSISMSNGKAKVSPSLGLER